MNRFRGLAILAVALFLGCDDGGDTGTIADATLFDVGGRLDQAPPDDQGRPDAAPDRGRPDATPVDASPPDASPPDMVVPCQGDDSCGSGRWCNGGSCEDGCHIAPDDCGEGRRCDAASRDCVDCIADELCGDSIDNDCNGTADDGCDCVPDAACQTELAGPCAIGRVVCEGGAPRCVPEVSDEVCNGADDDCDGTEDEGIAGLGEACAAGVGACARQGVMACTEGGQVACSVAAGAPAGELCNGLDDDCDGSTDEAFPDLGQACTVGRGVCERAGVRTCQDANTTRCDAVAAQPGAEACNTLDDDCDGRTDEGAVGQPLTRICYDGAPETENVSFCRAGQATCENGQFGACEGQVLPVPEICNGEDDDCDGRVDRTPDNQRLREACYTGPAGTSGVGVCVGGTAECQFGRLGACVGQVIPAAEICDQADNDCNGNQDDVAGGCACEPGQVRDCYPGPVGTNGQGLCRGGRQTCLADGSGFGACQGAVVPVAELCDGQDNDCDGSVDDAVAGVGQACTAGVGACAAQGVTSCNASEIVCDAVAGAPGAERCNAADDDCDGRTDEGFNLGRACEAGVGACAAQGINVCGPDGAVACNAVPAAPGAEVCNGGDDDCDGTLDEGLANLGACNSGRPGACAEGIRACRAGQERCEPAAPGEEVCNNQDDDCDLIVDEAQGDQNCGVGICARVLPICRNGAPVACDPLRGAVAEACNGLDDDCDGRTDEGLGLGLPCNDGQGVCSSPGVTICNVAGQAVCSGVPGQPRLEVCNLQDDDCDGTTDEDIEGVGVACGAGRGACRRDGQMQCVDGVLGCSVVAGQPTQEVCDAEDDDCDGLTDERLGVGNGCAAGVGECRRNGLMVCAPDGAVVCNAVPAAPGAETCNGFDDDCNGVVDNNAQGAGVACSAGIGGCFREGTVVCAQARLSCNAVPGQPNAEICDGIDNDCDRVVDDTPLDAGGACSEGVGACRANGTFACVNGALDCNAVPRQPSPEVCDNGDQDCDGRSDEGQPDCDANGFLDTCDIQFRRRPDCNLNGIPDGCDIAAGLADCDNDGTPDVCADACVADDQPPLVDLFVGGNPINRGTQIQVVVQAQDNVGVVECRLFVGAQEVPLDGNCQAFVTFNQPGFFDVIGLASDAAGNEGRDEVRMRVLDPNDVEAPVIAIHSPPNASTIRQATPVIASVADPNLVEWVLYYGPQANPTQNVLARGGQNVNNQQIGVLDPGVIPRGDYGIVLRAEDINGRARSLIGVFTIGVCEPVAEVCDFADNDCDGRADEGFPGVGEACELGVGACLAAGQRVCSANGGAVICNAQPGAPQAERCDLIDWDCNGSPLNGFAVGQACSTGLGLCRRDGVTQCNAAGDGVRCSVQPGQPQAEVCNSADDDCDGRIDEGACPDLIPPTLELVVDPLAAAVGEAVTIHAIGADNRGIFEVEVAVDGVPIALDGEGRGRFTPAVEGDYLVVGTVRDEAGNEARAEAVITAVTARPTAVVTVSPSRLGRGDNRRTVVTLDASASFGGGPLTYAWTIPDAIVVGGALNQPVVRVTLPADRDHPWSLRLTNALGADLAQGVVRINGAPLAVIDVPNSVPVGAELALDGSQSTDPEGDLLQFAWSLIESPPGSVRAVQGEDAELATFVPDVGGLYRFELIVGDGLEDSEPVTRAVMATSADLTAPAVAVQFSQNPAAPGAAVTITVQANDASGIAQRQLFIDGDEVALNGNNQAVFNPPAEGRYAVRALAWDRAGNLGGADGALFAASLADNGAPQVSISAPAGGHLAVAPFELRGTVTDADLAEYLVELSPRGANTWTTMFVGEQPVNNGVLALVDPSSMSGGQYDLRVQAFDDRGNSRSAAIIIEVAPKAAFGRMRRVFLDAQVTLAGIPIEVRRIYDSGLRTPGDFGVGWTLDVGAGRYEETNPIAEAWSWNGRCIGVFGPPGAVTETDNHIFTIFLGDEAFRFQGVMVFEACGGGFQQVAIEYRALPGTRATLTPTNDPVAWHIAGEVFTTDSLELWTPGLLRLTLPDGRVVFYDPELGVRRVEEGAGQVLTIDAQGIHHSNGISVRTTRDAQGRITAMRLPDDAVRTYHYNGRNDLIRTVDFRGSETFYEYNLDHYLLRIVDPRGNVPMAMEYDETGRLIAYVDAEGNRIEVGHNGAARQEVITDRRGNRTIYSYDANGNVLEIIDALGGRTTFTYDAAGRILTQTDPLGNVTRNTYDANGNRTEKLDPNGERWLWSYNAAGKVLSETDPEGNVTTYAYNAAGKMTRQEDPTGAVSQWTYDASGRNTQVVDPEGNATQLAYAASGALERITDPAGVVVNLTNDRTGNPVRSVHMRSTIQGEVQEEWRYNYEGDGEIGGVVGPDGATADFVRDEVGQIVGASDPNGETGLTLDALGRVRERRTPGGGVLRIDFDSEGNNTAAVLPGGARFERTFDALNRPETVRTPEGGVVRQVYDAGGRIVRRTTALGFSMEHDYDAVGNVVRTRAPGNAETLFERDGAGRLTAMTDAEGGRWIFDLDGKGRILRKGTPDGREERWTYDGTDRALTWTEPGGAQWSYDWTPTGDLGQVTDPLGQVTRYEYDGGGRLHRATDSEGRITSWLFDSMGRLLERRMPAGEVERMTYDARGLVSQRTDFDGEVTRYAYDEGGRRVQLELPSGEIVRTAYDTAGREVRVEDSRGTTLMDRDVRGRVLRWEGPRGDVLTRQYDLDGRLAESTTDAGTARYTYNGRSELTRIQDPDAHTYDITRDRLGRATAISLPDGSRRTRIYDAVGRVVRITHQDAQDVVRVDLAYTYNASGRVAQVVEDDGRTVAYTYDANGRVLEERITTPGGGVETIQYAYSPTGNVTRRIDGQGARDFRYDANDRLLDDGRFTYTWDASGRLIGRRGQGIDETWRYDGQGRLVAVERVGQPAVEYAYDHDGLLAERTVAGSVQHFIWDRASPLPTLMEVREDNGELVERYVHGADGVLAKVLGDGSLQIPVPDHLGTVRAIDAGGVLARHRYDAYGAPRGPAAAGPGYIGAWTDPTTGLVFLQARWYSPGATRFITPDPDAGDPSDPRTINRYVYGFGDPINRSDPNGEFSLVSVSISLSIVSVLAGLAIGSFGGAMDFILSGLGTFRAMRFRPQTAVMFPFFSASVSRGFIGAGIGFELLKFNSGVWALYFYFGLVFASGQPSQGFSANLNLAMGVVYDTPDPQAYLPYSISVTASGSVLIAALTRKLGPLPLGVGFGKALTIFWSPTETYKEGTTSRYGHGWYHTAQAWSFGGGVGASDLGKIGFSMAISFAYYFLIYESSSPPDESVAGAAPF